MEVKSRRYTMQELQADLEDLATYIEDLWRFLPLPTCYVNPVDHILNVNQSFTDFLGYTNIEIIGRQLAVLFVDKNKARQFIKEIKIKNNLQAEITLLTKKKKRPPARLYSQLRKDREGNIIGYFLGLVDITQEKNFQRELGAKVEERTKKLQEKIEEMEKFYKIAVGRELKMVEQKKEIEKLKKELEKK